MSAGRPSLTMSATGTCWMCGKRTYRSRSEARGAARKIHPGEKMTAYQCGLYWHFGHDEGWRWRPADDLYWQPLPDRARRQITQMARSAA